MLNSDKRIWKSVVCLILSIKVLFPEDMGPAAIDVSNYPLKYQNTYREIFLPVFNFLGETARTVNSPETSSSSWKKEVERIHRRPPCCGACPVLSRKQAKELWEFLVYDSVVRKTGPNALAWAQHRENLLERFRREYPQRYKELKEKIQ
ncbi:MAG: hypothetical protein HY400_05740 [Elusimicrobia bacterium]|nr:hypothetical protein [Elusimicrobiota bacterium]